MKKNFLFTFVFILILGGNLYSQIPNPPVLANPPANASLCTLVPTMSWYSSQGATSYGLQISSNPTFTSLILNINGITDTQYSVQSGILYSNTTYYWRVNATGPGGTSGWSTIWQFSILSVPTPPTLITPPNGTLVMSLTPAFLWNAIGGPFSFRFQLATDSNFQNIIKDTITVGSVGNIVLNYETTYYWRVSSITTSCGQGIWSIVFHFYTMPAPMAAPILISPPNHSAQGLTPLFSWSLVAGAQNYRIQVSTSPIFNSSVINTIVTNPTYSTPPGVLSIFTTYYWRVGAINAVGQGPWSSVWDFHTVPFYSVSGTVKYNDNNQIVTSGSVKAFKLDKYTGNIMILDSTQINSNGSYTLPDVPQDSLDIGVFPNSTPQPDYVITYYPSTAYWQNAAILYPTTNLYNINILAIRKVNISNTNSINGKVSRTGDINSNIKDAVIYAKNGNTYVGCVTTDTNGVYHLQSLPSGTLKIIVNRLGFSGDSTNVTISSMGNIDSVNFQLSAVFTGIKPVNNIIPDEFKLYQNYPNPFNPTTKIKFDLPKSNLTLREAKSLFVQIKIYDITGREIATLVNESLQPGTYEVAFDGSKLTSGIYFYRFVIDNFSDTKRMVFIK